MRLTVTVRHGVTGVSADVVYEASPETTLGELVAQAAPLIRAAVERTDPPSAGLPPIAVDGVRVAAESRVGDGVVLEGSVLTVGGPAWPGRLPPDLPSIRVVGGPGAGTVFCVDPGVVVVGSAPEATVRLAGEGIAPVAALVQLDGAGRFSITPVACDDPDVPAVAVDGVALTGTVALTPSSVVEVGEALLGVADAGTASAAIRLAEGGARLEHARPPRLLPEPPTTAFRYPAQPQAPPRRPLPIVAAAAPLVLASVMVLVLDNPTFLVFGLLSPVVLVGNHLYDRRNGRVTHRDALAKHQATRAAVRADAAEAVLRLQDELRASCPDPAALLDVAVRRRARLWERRRDDPDHLAVRIGTADLPSGVTVDDPDLLEHRRTVASTARTVPVTVALADRGVVGLHGRTPERRALAAWMVAQLCVLQSPRDVQLVVLTDQDAADHWSWLSWVPHARPDDADASCRARIGNDTETVARRLAEVAAVVEGRHRSRRESSGAVLDAPDVVLVVDGSRRLRALPGLVTVLRDGPAVGVVALCLDADRRSLPEECATVVRAGRGTHGLSAHREADVQEVRADLLPPGWHETVARALAPVVDVDDAGDAGGLPARSRLLDVLGLDEPTGSDVLARWARTGPSTEVLIGQGLDGPFSVDLRRDGPHGLVAGTTGSGKSELLQSVVASLAATNTPDSMTFVLVDYKGGAAFRDCGPLPHTVGMVTDLDPHLVERALTSLGAELRRREELLALAAAKDLEDYEEARRRPGARALPTLPRLLIVIDEFASLARELPDFVTGLVDVAQRGRSLGIHLILATQRPSGVVSSEIRANTNLRIALRVTDAGESTDVIDAPDACRIPRSTPGRALVRLGAGALLPFQAGRVGGRSVTAAQPERPWSAAVPWETAGSPAPRPPAWAPGDAPGETDLVQLVAAVREAEALRGGAPPHRPWLDALPPLVPLDGVTSAATGPHPTFAGRLPPLVIGLEDHPGEQLQRAAVVDLDVDGHLFVAGAPRSGRSQVLRTLAASVVRHTSCADVHLYGIDCGSGALLPLVSAPHTGAVVRRTEVDRVRRLLARLVEETLRRQAVLAAGGHASVDEQRRAATEHDRLPHLVVMIDPWEGFLSSLGDLDHGEPVELVTLLLREGAAAGVHVVVTGDRLLVTGRMATLVERRLVLRLADRADYGLAGIDPRALPDDPGPGRGVDSSTGAETQVAVLGDDPSGSAQADLLRAAGEAAGRRDLLVPDERRPFRLDRLEGDLTFADAWSRRGRRSADGPFALVGIGGDDLLPVGPALADAPGTFLVLGPPRSGRSTVLLSMVRSLLEQGTEVVVVTPRPSPLRELDGTPGVLAVLRGTDLGAGELEPFLGEGAPTGRVLVVDDAELVKDAPASTWLAAFVRECGDGPSMLLAAGSAAEAGVGFLGWYPDLRRNRCGAVLSPRSTADGEHVGVQLARSSTSARPRPGIAHVHLGDGVTVTVTVPHG
jgi:S-DNA-T family DNA segregation ATPase FtsK/SpoIIIE